MGPIAARLVYAAVFVALAALYYAFLGPGPTPSERGMDLPWWRPMGWALALDWPALSPLQDISYEYEVARHQGRWEPRGAIPFALFALPPILMGALGFVLFRATGRVLVLAGVLTLCAFVYYGWLDPATWEDYSWRWPIAIFVTSLYVSTFALAHTLVEALRARSRPVQAFALLAFAAPIYLLITEVTGTNPELEWNLSPWPVITLYGFTLFGLVFGVIHLAAGLGLAVGSRVRGAAGVALCLAVAAGTAALLRGIPFAYHDLLRIAVLALPAAALAGLALRRSPKTAGATAACFVVAGAVILASIKAGQWQAEYFQAEARDEISPRVIAALEAYREDRDAYPLELSELVPDYLPEIPDPRVGWFGEEGEAYAYVDLGDSYLLEFSNAMWVQCHYSPPYSDEEGEVLEGSWSCEPRPPRLW